MWNEQEHEFFEDNFISITKTTSERIWKGVENPAETIGLYMFYADVAKWQKTNTVKATSGYVMKGTGWGRMKFRKIKQNLLDLKLIEDIVRISDEGEVIGHYVKVSYLFDKPLYKNAKKTEKKEKSVQINRGKKNENKKDSVLAVLENTKKGGVLISHTV